MGILLDLGVCGQHSAPAGYILLKEGHCDCQWGPWAQPWVALLSP